MNYGKDYDDDMYDLPHTRHRSILESLGHLAPFGCTVEQLYDGAMKRSLQNLSDEWCDDTEGRRFLGFYVLFTSSVLFGFGLGNRTLIDLFCSVRAER